MKSIYDQRYGRVIDMLRDVRRQLGLTQLQVADSLGWHRTALSNVETRERRLDLLEAYELCQVYGLQLSDLERVLEGEGAKDAAQPT